MPDVEYILRIILRARDEMAAVLAKARTQLRGFAADADKMNLSVDKLNKSMSQFNTNMDGVSKKLESWRAVLRDAGRDSEKAAKSIDNVGKSAQRSATSTQRAAQTQEQLQKAARNLRKDVEELTKARGREAVSAKFAASEYERLSKELEKVSLNMSNAARTKTPAQTWALQAKEAAEQIKQTDKEITDDAKAQTKQRETNAQEAERIRLANVKAHNKQVEQEILDQIGRQEAAEQRRVAMIKLSNAAIGREIEQQIKDEVAASKNAEQEKARIRADGERQRVAMVKLANSQIAAEIERQLKDEEAHANREANIKRLTGQRGDLNKAVLAGGRGVDREQARRLAQDFDKLSRSFENGSAEARHWAQEAANVKGVLSSLESDTNRAGGAVSKFAHAAEGGANSAGRMGNSIGALDNQARGLGLLLVIGSMQQLISVAISLGGELVSLASSAAMAGGALGGILAAGAAQALPVFGLLAGAMQRVKSVFDVFQQSQKLQQAQFTDAEKAGQKQIDTTNQLANATDNQSEAQDRLAESRKALNQANADGVRQLEDLIYQEKAAALAAQGASLNVREAQKALQDAITGGASSLEIQQRQQALDEARQGAGRSRVTARRATEDRQAAGGRVGGLESVQNAQKAVKDAEQGLVRANRALDQAADKTDRVASATMTAQANLDYLLSQLSPAERRLYFAFQSLYDNYKRIFQGTSDKDGIYGVIVDSFTRAVQRVNQIIQQPDVITSIQNLANSIGAAFNEITDSFTDTETIDQFQQIIGDAGENLGPLVGMAIDLGHAFLNIAETANPAFQDLIKYVGPIVDKFLALTADKGAMEDFFSTGEKHLESWLDLFLAVGRLFAALIGASAGEGKKSIEDLTSLIDGWTDKLQSNGDKVRSFFKQARQGAFEILGVLIDLGKTLFGSFDPDTISNFADILHKSVIPALGDVIEVVGKLSDFLSGIADNKYGAEFLRYGLAFLFFAQMAASSLAALRLMGGLVRVVGDQFGHLRDGVRFLRALPGQLDRVGQSFRTVGMMAEEMGGKYTLVGKAMLGVSKAMEAMRVASALMFGPWGLAAALIIVGVVLLLKHFHKLDDVWRGLKAAFQIFLDAIQPALKSLQDALEDMGIHVGSFTDALSVVEAVGKRVANIITVVLVEAFKGLAHVLAGVAILIIRTFTGLINIVHGIVDVIIGIFTGDWDQVLNGVENLVKGIVDIMGGVIEGIVQVFEGFVGFFVGIFEKAWEAVKDFFGVHSPSTLAAELGRDIIRGLVAGARGAVRALGRLAGWVWDKIRDGFHTLGAAERRLASWLIDRFVDFLRAEIRGFEKVGHWIWNAIKDSVRAVGGLAKGIASWLWDKFAGFLRAEIRGWVNVGTWIWNALSDAVKGIGGRLIDLGKSIGGKIVSGIKSAVGAVKGAFGFGDDDKKNAPAPAQKQATADEVNRATGVIPFGAKDLDTAQRMYGDFWKGMRDTTRVTTNAIQKEFRDMKNSTAANADKMYKEIRGSLADIQKSFSVRGDTIVKNWSADWFDLMKVTNQGLFYIGHETNKALTALGEKHINFGLTAPKKSAADGKAAGGWIGNQGERGKDRGFYPLGAGEAVLNWAHQSYVEPAMNAYYGHGLGEMFGRVRGYHAGGPGQAGFAGGRAPQFAPIPGMPGEEANTRIIPLLVKLISKYHAIVTDAYDRDHSAGHLSPGHNVTGTAADMVPRVQTAAGWNMIEAMGKWAVSKGMVVGYGAGVPGSQAWPGHGRGNHIHIEFGGNPSAAGVVLEQMAKIGRPVVTGGGMLAKLAQAAVDKVLKVANNKLTETFAATQGGATDFKVGKVGAGAGPIFRFFRQHGFSDEQAAAWVGNFQQESGLDPSIVQPGGEGHGLAQWGHGRFDALMAFAGRHKKPWQDMGTQLAYVMYELGGSERGAMKAIKSAKTVEAATNAIGTQYERFGIQGDRAGPARDAFRKYAGKFAEGGIVPGGEGTPVGIIAHAGEWILNRFQQSSLAQMLGMNAQGLRGMLGFHGGGGHYQGGGEINTRLGRVPRVRPIADANLALRRGLENYHALMDVVSAVWIAIGKQSTSALAKSKKANSSYVKIGAQIDRLFADKGTLETLATAISDQFSKAEVKLKAATFRLRGGVVVKSLGEIGIANRELKNVIDNYKDLVGERGVINRGLRTIDRQLTRVAKDPNLTKTQRTQRTNDLNAQRKLATDALDKVDSQIADSIEARWNAQVAVQQAAVDDINKRHEDRSATLDLSKRVFAALGNQAGVGRINTWIAANIRSNINELTGRIATARKTGNTALVDTLTKQIAELQAQVVELAAAALQDAIDAIAKTGTRQRASLDLFGRMADAMGIVGNAAAAVIPGVGGVGGLGSMSRAQVAQGRVNADIQERAGYIGQLGTARAQGNVGQIEALTDKINELTVSIVENTKAARDARFAATQDEFDFNTSINDLNKQLVEATDATTNQTSTSQLLILANARQTLLTERGIEIQNQLTEAINEGDVKASRDLEKQLIENKIAVQQNTKAVNDLTGAGTAPSTFTSTLWQWFGEAFLTGTGGIIPQYLAPSNLMAGLTGGGANAASSSSVNNGDTNINIEINEAGQPIDPTRLASTVVFAQATASN